MFILKDDKEANILLNKNDYYKKEYDDKLLTMNKNNFFSKVIRKVSSKVNRNFLEKESELFNKEQRYIDFNNLYNEILALDQFYYGLRYKTKTVYDKDTYEQCLKLYKKVRNIIDRICNEEELKEEDIIKYSKVITLTKKYFRKVGFFMIVNDYDIDLHSEDINNLEKNNFDLKEIISRAFKEEWDYNYFIKFISVYKKYQNMCDSANQYLKNEQIIQMAEEASLNEYLENYRAYAIMDNPNILNDYDKKTLLSTKKKIYKMIKQCKDIEEENKMIDIVKNINLTISKK